MSTPPQHSSHPLIGRDHELEHLRAALGNARSEHGQFVLTSGEPGIGKTTLVTHLLDEASNSGFLVLTGHCYDLETTPPYGPWKELLRDIEIELPDLSSPTSSSSATTATPRTATIEEEHADIVGQFRDMAHQQPLALLLEDMHLSDQVSLDLVRRLARQITDVPILLIVTYRDLGLIPERPLYHILPHLIRESVTLRVTLQPLQQDALRHLIHLRYGLSDEDEARLAAHVDVQAEGNPFFIEELLSDLEHRGILEARGESWVLGDLDDIPVPPLVRQVVDGRLARLTPSTRELLEIAAVIGMSIPVDLWQEVSDVSDEEIASALDDAVAQGVLTEDRRRAGFRFHHALVRQALYESLVLPRRRHWHRRIGEALAPRSRAEPLSVAHHLWEARDRRAVEWLLRAGEQSARAQVANTAVEQFSRAVSLAEEFAQPVPSSALRGRGEAYALLGAFDQAHADYDHLLDVARASDNRELEWQCLVDLGELWTSRDYQRSGDYFQAALEIAELLGDSSLLAHSLISLGKWLLNTGDPSRAIDHHRRALEIFEAAEDMAGTATAANMLGIDHLIQGDLIRTRERSLQAANLFEQLDQPAQMASALAALIPRRGVYEFAFEVLDPDPHPETRSIVNRIVETARAIPWRAGEAHARIALGSHLALHGDYGEGLELAAAGLELATEIEHREWIALGNIVLGMIHLDLLDVERSLEFLERGRAQAAELGSFVHLHLASAPLIESYLLAGDLAQAHAAYDALGLDDSRTATSVERGALVAHARLALEDGSPDEALLLVDRLIAATPNVTPEHISPPLASLRGEALAMHERLVEAERELATAERAARSEGRTPLRWRVLTHLADVQVRLGNRDEAARTTAEARWLIQQLADTVSDSEDQDRFLERARSSLPSLRSTDSSTISERELEVLRLAAQGLTNVEIGEQLFISPRTVKGHLQSVYNKLGVNTRTAAATVAIERGLL